jgi:acetoin utilization deacetylase AcuC-like enzyme
MTPHPSGSTAARYAEHKAMLAALEAGTATPDQQRAAFAHLAALKRQHNQDIRDQQSEAQAAYREGRWDAASEARGEPYGTY